MNQHLSEAIDRENRYANAKWPDPKSIGDFIMVLEAEVAEAKADYIKGRHIEALSELLQCAAVAVNCIEQHGIHERNWIEIHQP